MNMRFEIADLRNAIQTLLVNYPELADDDQLRLDTIEGETSLDSVLAKLLDNASEASEIATAIKGRIDDLQARKARYERKEDAMRDLILSLMQRADLPKIVLPEATLTLRNIPPGPMVIDAASVPDDCVRIERKPDMKAIRAAMDNGRSVPGVAMSNGKVSLTIRTK